LPASGVLLDYKTASSVEDIGRDKGISGEKSIRLEGGVIGTNSKHEENGEGKWGAIKASGGQRQRGRRKELPLTEGISLNCVNQYGQEKEDLDREKWGEDAMNK